MQNEEPKKLLVKYQAGQCTEVEKTLVERWYMHFNEEDMDVPPETIEAWGNEIRNKLPVNESSARKIKLWSLAVAASIVLTIGIGLFYYKTETLLEKRLPQDIAPGGNQATLTLANGKVINLSNAKAGIVIDANKLTYTDGSAVTNAGNNTGIQVITTPKGGQYQVILPDDTKVWLNAATTIHFPQSFAGSVNRKIEISGEAYLEVAKDKAHPFIVKSKMQEITVLGTHFNISAYEDEAITKSTLLEGSIKINDNILIKPGEQATNTGASIKVEQVDTDNSVAWKNGEFMFRRETLESIMRKIARWYDVEVIYTDKQQGTKLFGGTISRFTNVSEVLNMLQLTGQVHFKIEGRRIMVLK